MDIDTYRLDPGRLLPARLSVIANERKHLTVLKKVALVSSHADSFEPYNCVVSPRHDFFFGLERDMSPWFPELKALAEASPPSISVRMKLVELPVLADLADNHVAFEFCASRQRNANDPSPIEPTDGFTFVKESAALYPTPWLDKAPGPLGRELREQDVYYWKVVDARKLLRHLQILDLGLGTKASDLDAAFDHTLSRYPFSFQAAEFAGINFMKAVAFICKVQSFLRKRNLVEAKPASQRDPPRDRIREKARRRWGRPRPVEQLELPSAGHTAISPTDSSEESPNLDGNPPGRATRLSQVVPYKQRMARDYQTQMIGIEFESTC